MLVADGMAPIISELIFSKETIPAKTDVDDLVFAKLHSKLQASAMT